MDNSPHVFTVFRTSNNAMSISFAARDASGRTVTDQMQGINLQSVSLGGAPLLYHRRLMEAEPRELLFGRRRSSDSRRRSYTDSRRRTAMLSPRRRTVVSSPRRRMLDNRRRTATIDESRRRAVSDYGERRRAPVSDYSRRRLGYGTTGRRRSSFSTYSNPAYPGMGSYGYANQNYAYHNYGGHMPMSTPYGYSGANAYQGGSGSGMKIALAGGAGLLAGIAADRMMHHHFGGYSQQQIMNSQCSTGLQLSVY